MPSNPGDGQELEQQRSSTEPRVSTAEAGHLGSGSLSPDLARTASAVRAAAVLGRQARGFAPAARTAQQASAGTILGVLQARSAAAQASVAGTAALTDPQGHAEDQRPELDLEVENQRLREELEAMKKAQMPQEDAKQDQSPVSSPENAMVRRVRLQSGGESPGKSPPSSPRSERSSMFQLVRPGQRNRPSLRQVQRSASRRSLDFEVEAKDVTKGQLEFIRHGTHDGREVMDSDTDSLKEARQAKFVKIHIPSSGCTTSVRDLEFTAQKARVKLLQGLSSFMHVEWGMSSPSVIISVTGNAQDVALRPIFEQQFQAALLNATRCTNAWITTGGTNQGIMRLVGDALKEYKQMSVCLGIASWGPLDGKDSLQAASQGVLRLSSAELDVENPKGSIDNPFIYTGSSLDKNHSHYILVDAGSHTDFGAEITFRHELEDFVSFRRDSTGHYPARLAHEIAKEQKSDSKRSIPVICVCFGGGPGSVETLQAAMNSGRPIIVVKGSMRIADCVVGLFELKMKDVNKATLPQSGSVSPRARRDELRVQQKCLIAEYHGGEFKGLDEEKKLALIEIAEYSQLYVFDLFKKVAHSENKNSVDNPMLPVVLQAIFESTTVEQRNQLPLAIRYNDRANVQKVLGGSGIKIHDDRSQELTVDGRQLIFAAFYDNAKIVREMLQSGFDVSQLDHLIALEIRQEMCTQKLLERRRNDVSWYSSPMPNWTNRRQRQGCNQEEINEEWRELSHEEQVAITIEELRTVTWDKLPFVNGWTYRVIVQADKETKVKVAAGTLFRQINARKVKPSPFLDEDGNAVAGVVANQRVGIHVKEIELVCMDRRVGHVEDDELVRLKPLWGEILTEKDATPYIVKHGRNDYTDLNSDSIRTMARMVGVANATAVKLQDASEVYVKVDHPDLGWLILRREPTDEIVGCLDLGGKSDRSSEGMQRTYRKKFVGSLMYNRAAKAFAPWLEEAVAEYDLMEQPFDPLLRIFWAISTRRDGLVKEFWMDTSNPDVFQPFAGALLASYTYRNLGMGSHTTIQRRERSRKKLKKKWDGIAADLLDCMEGSGNVLYSGTQVFDKYLFFGEDEEELWRNDPDTTKTEFGHLTPTQRVSNTSVRSALQLMGSDTRTEWTHVDLALVAENKDFVGHRHTNQFVDDVWISPCASDRGFHRCCRVSPRQKYIGRLISWCLFMVLYIVVYTRYEYPSVVHKHRVEEGRIAIHDNQGDRALEGCFWLWVITMCISEHYQYRTDFDSLPAYVMGHGNLSDMVMMSFFFFAAICRCLAVAFSSSTAYLAMHIILMIDLIVCTWRLSVLLCVQRGFGMMMIVIKSIVRKDLWPFLLLAIIFIGGFEVSSFFFSWSRSRQQIFGEYFNIFTAVNEDLVEYQKQLGILWWERPSTTWIGLTMAFKTVFFVSTVVVLMNLLIAVLTDRFAKINDLAEVEWRLVNAKLVKEHFESTVLPTPFNAFEYVAEMVIIRTRWGETKTSGVPIAGSTFQQSLRAWPAFGGILGVVRLNSVSWNFAGKSSLWGRYYVFPPSTMDYELQQAMSRYSVQKKRKKAMQRLLRSSQIAAGVSLETN